MTDAVNDKVSGSASDLSPVEPISGGAKEFNEVASAQPKADAPKVETPSPVQKPTEATSSDAAASLKAPAPAGVTSPAAKPAAPLPAPTVRAEVSALSGPNATGHIETLTINSTAAKDENGPTTLTVRLRNEQTDNAKGVDPSRQEALVTYKDPLTSSKGTDGTTTLSAVASARFRNVNGGPNAGGSQQTRAMAGVELSAQSKDKNYSASATVQGGVNHIDGAKTDITAPYGQLNANVSARPFGADTPTVSANYRQEKVFGGVGTGTVQETTDIRISQPLGANVSVNAGYFQESFANNGKSASVNRTPYVGAEYKKDNLTVGVQYQINGTGGGSSITNGNDPSGRGNVVKATAGWTF